MSENKKKLFDFAIGNPPYQEELKGTSDKPIYNYFLDASYDIANVTEMIHPARFLFNAGKTPKNWNEKMLKNTHLKVLMFEKDSSKIFSNTDIKGGVAITYHDSNQNFGEIGLFTGFKELNLIFYKTRIKIEKNMASIIYTPESYKFTKKIHEDFPNLKQILSNGHEFDIVTNIFEKIPNIFKTDKNEESMIGFVGRNNFSREIRYIKREYIQEHENLDYYKVILPKANGSGAFGEILTNPIIGYPQTGHTQTFISIGKFEKKTEAENCLKYIKTKYARAMLGVLKVTQLNNKPTWTYVPLQDFTENSDIDWSKSIAEIDQQLYKKYNLSPEEIAFIEEKVKEME